MQVYFTLATELSAVDLLNTLWFLSEICKYFTCFYIELKKVRQMCVLSFFLLFAFALKNKSAFEACSVHVTCSNAGALLKMSRKRVVDTGVACVWLHVTGYCILLTRCISVWKN